MKARITFIITLVCLLTGISVKAQNNLSNINVQQQDTVIYVSYDLQQKSDIYLYVSLNDGRSFLGPMNYVSGDVGYNVRPGDNKVIFWYAVSEMGYFSNSNVRFKIVAKSSKDGYLNKADLQYVKVDGEKPFEIGMTEVTIYQYAQFVENTGYKTTAELSGYSYVWNGSSWEKRYGVKWNTDNNGRIISLADSQSKPVTNLSYKDVVAFCEWAGCRLPSVEEWTIAAKGGEQTIYGGSNKANDVAWSYDNASGKTHDVASKKANAFGIYDMCGNVAEWTSDKTGNEYVFCGGDCYSDSDNCTVNTRSHSVATGSNSLVGFRVVKASSKDAALPAIMIDEDRNDRPSFTEQRGFTTQSGVPAAGNKINGHEYVDLGLPSGTLWATCNVGAIRPEDYGYYYTWGETTPGGSHFDWDTYKWCNGSAKTFTKYCTKSRRGTVDKKTVLELEDDAAHVNWGGAWRMPTRDEMKELKEKCTWTRTTQGGKNGCRVTGPNGNSIFLPAAGNALPDRIICDGDIGSYWSSSLCTGCLFGTTEAYDLSFGYWRRHLADVEPWTRYFAVSVRPVCAAGSISAPAVTTSSVSNITQTTAICDGQNKTFTVKGVSFEMVAVKGGTFTMGASSGDSYADSDEKPTHSVTLSDYYIGKFEVTQELWEAVMGSNPSYFKGSKLPVESVSWDDCQTFIRKLNSLTGANFRLPTEAEWEYAARAGSEKSLYGNENIVVNGKNNSPNLDRYGWYGGNCGQHYTASEGCDESKGYDISGWEAKQYGDKRGGTHPVGRKTPNAWGIYDMLGNVWEWCQDWYGSYGSGSQTNPQGPSSGSDRVIRGGSWPDYAQGCRVSYRPGNSPDSRCNYLGLRLVVSQ